LWFCCLPVASLIVGRVQRSNLSKSGSEAHYSSTFTIMIKTKIHPHALLVHGWSLFWFIKAKKITDIPQTQAGFKAKSLGILCGIPRLFNAKSRCVCRNRRYFRLFRYTLG
jgi:hypothetical protein